MDPRSASGFQKKSLIGLTKPSKRELLLFHPTSGTMRTSRPILAGVFLVLTCICGCAKPNLRDSLSSMQAPQGSPMLLAVYQPCLGNGEHINVRYSCPDPIVLGQHSSLAPERDTG